MTMNVLAYSGHQPEKVAARVEEKLREEMGAPAPIPCCIERNDADMSAAATARWTAGLLIGGHCNYLCTLVFDLITPRPAQLQASVYRQGVGCQVGRLLYSAELSKPITGEVVLEQPKVVRASQFTGNAEVATQLNANRELLNRLGEFSRIKSRLGGRTTTVERLVKITSHDGGALVLISTMPRAASMGFRVFLDPKEFFEILEMLEIALTSPSRNPHCATITQENRN
jgi:hypothetical protein